MKTRTSLLAAGVFLWSVLVSASCLGFNAPKPGTKEPDTPTQKGKEPSPSGATNLTPLDIKLPKPVFKGTPKHVPPGTNLEKPRKGARKLPMVPKGTENVAVGKEVTSSDDDPIIGEIKLVTDGDKEANEGNFVELGPGVQWVQIDLKRVCEIHAVVIWHYHANARVYHDVVVQVADDEDFITNVRTLFNNDHDNSAGLGLGDDLEYWDTYEGKLIDTTGGKPAPQQGGKAVFRGVKSRHLRLYSNGSTEDDQNHYTEVEVFGLPVR